MALLAALFASAADAATRYAAPGGKGTAPCAERANPCPLFIAAEKEEGGRPGAHPGDEVVLAPGTYVDVNGDMGTNDNIALAPGIQLHGEAGASKPVLVFVNAVGGLGTAANDTVSGITIVGQGSSEPFSLGGGIAERIVVESEGGSGACRLELGMLRDSACLASGEGEAAIVSFPMGGTSTSVLRNVTAVSTGAESVGIFYFAQSANLAEPAVAHLDAKGVIAKGTGTDVRVVAVRHSTVEIALDHSDYDTVFPEAEAESAATITPAGSGTNITEPPLLSGDSLHELAGSPTIDRGEVDASTGAFDVEGQRRTIGAVPDIGADEFALPTQAAVSCPPTTTNAISTCTVVVRDASSPLDPPLGTVTLGSIGGEFSADGCALTAVSPTESRCSVGFRSGFPGLFLIFGEYEGDSGHLESSDDATVSVLPSREELQPQRPETFLRRLRGGKSDLARFAFISSQPHATFECSLDRGGFKPCRSPMKVRVRPGKHVFRVRAKTGSILDPTPAVVHWRVAARSHKKRR